MVVNKIDKDRKWYEVKRYNPCAHGYCTKGFAPKKISKCWDELEFDNPNFDCHLRVKEIPLLNIILHRINNLFINLFNKLKNRLQ